GQGLWTLARPRLGANRAARAAQACARRFVALFRGRPPRQQRAQRRCRSPSRAGGADLMSKASRPAWPLRLAAAAALAAVAALLMWASLGGLGLEPSWLQLSPAQIEEFAASWGMWSAAASMALMVLHSFVPIPAEVIAVANGMMFGPWRGTLVTWSGAMLGAISAFAVARWLGRPVVRRLVAEERRAGIEAWTRRPGSLLVL